jgi:hypothetical protein
LAEKLGVHHSTVAQDIKDIEDSRSISTVGNPTVETVIGKDSKKRKARTNACRTGRPAPKKKPKPLLCARCQRNGGVKDCPQCAEVRNLSKERDPGDDTELEEGAAQEQWLDAECESVPNKATIAFERAKEMAAICRQIDGIIRRVEELANGPGGRLLNFNSFRQQVGDAKGHLWANRPTHVCPYCRGKKDRCECCNGEGWTNKLHWQNAPGNNGKAKG